jgi:hypothetical protein
MDKIVSMVLLAVLAIAFGIWRGSYLMRQQPGLAFHRAHRNLPEIQWLLPTCLLMSLLTWFVFTHYQYLWHVPVLLDVWALPFFYAVSAGILFYIFSLGLVIAVRSKNAERWKLVFAGVAMFGSLNYLYYFHCWPIYRQLWVERRSSDYVLQTSSYSCGAASAANLLRAHGIPGSEREMARLAGTCVLGTSPGELIYALRAKGLATRKYMVPPEQLRVQNKPAILLVDYPGMGPLAHAILFEKHDGTHFIVVDPLYGHQSLSETQLVERWRGHTIY